MRPLPHPVRAVICALLVSLLLPSGCRPKTVAGPTRAPVTLRFAYRQHTVDMRPLLDDFHAKYPWITVEAKEMERWGDQLDLAVTDSTIDIFRGGREGLAYAQRGLIKPLDDLQLGDWASIRGDYLEGTWEALSIQGQQWGIPAGVDPLTIYVNLDQAKALKVSVPESTWSLFDFLELVTKLNYPDGLPHNKSAKLFGFCTTPESIDPVTFIYLHGGRIVDDLNSPSVTTLDDPLTIEAVEWYAALFNRHNVAPNPKVIASTFRRGGIYEAAFRGVCGVWIYFYSGRGGLDTPYKWPFKWKMLPLPKDRADFGAGEIEGYYITDGCEHPTEALKLLRFLSDRWEAAGQKLPPRHSLIEKDGYEDAVGKDVAAVARTFANKIMVMPSENMPKLEQLGGILISDIKRIIAQDLDPADVLPETQQRVRFIFESP